LILHFFSKEICRQPVEAQGRIVLMFLSSISRLHGCQGSQAQADLQRPAIPDRPVLRGGPADQVCDDEAILQPFFGGAYAEVSLSRMNSVICMEDLAVATM
jgi:hypothetical protein